MGIFGAIAEGIVAIKYTANVDEAVAAVKGLSGEQKKAAKQAIEAHKEEREAFKKKVEEFGKGAAIIGGALLVARNGLQAYREESRLMAGAAGVDIDDLSKAYDGLRTRTELLTLAQAGHQGAWKLTTAQIENVIGGMRALEKKGFDSTEVFEKFTDVIKKGKLEGLDDFGLSLKATGNQTEDLKVLMNALGSEVLDVGGNFEKAGDAATRATTQMADGVSRLRVVVGQATNALLDMAASFGRGWGEAIFGPLPEDNGPGGKASAYADMFARVGGAKVNDPNGVRIGNRKSADYLFTQAGDADRQAGQRLAAFSSALRQGMQGRGPLATKTPEEFAQIVSGLPKDWRLVDDFLAKRVDEMQAKLTDRFNTVGVDAANGILAGFKNAFSKNRDATKRGRGGGRGRGAAAANDNAPTIFDGILGTASGFYDFAMGQAAANQQAQSDALAAYQDRMSQRFADAQMLQDMEAWRTAKAKSDEESFLAKTFGPLEEFDQYAAGFATLKGAVQDGFAAWIDGSESLGTAIQKSIAGSLRAYAIEMSGKALVAGAEALFYLAQGNIAGATTMGLSAAKYVAAAGALGMLAKGLGGGSGVAASAAGVPSGAPGGARPAPQSGVVIVGDPLSDDSPRERQRRVRRAMNAAGRPNEGVRYG